MNSFSKLFALAFLAAGTALVTSAAPSGAQASRIAVPSGIALPYPNTPVCCTPAQRPVVTNASWMVKTPSGASGPAVPLSATPYYHVPLPGSQWIGHLASDGTYSNNIPASGNYVYTYHFCLCGLPPKVPNQPFPAAMSLSILSDNAWTAYLNRYNGHPAPIGSFATSPQVFTTIHGATAPSANFVAGDNVLEIDVNNDGGPTGLDVGGLISGYFQTPCGPRDPTGRSD
jgi:hypothetical protein